MVKIEKTGTNSYRLARSRGGALASFDPLSKRFKLLGSTGNADARESLLHEVQHAIQEIEGWQGGASRDAMASKVYRYQASSMMVDIYENSEAYVHLSEDQLKFALKEAFDVDEETVRPLLREAQAVLSGRAKDDQLNYWLELQDRFANEAARWMSTVVHFDGNEGLQEIVENLNPGQLESLASLRYSLDLGEMEARLTQALSLVPQETIEKFALNPHQLMKYLDGNALRKMQEEIPEVRRMEFAAPIEDAITDTSRGKIQDRGLMDVQ